DLRLEFVELSDVGCREIGHYAQAHPPMDDIVDMLDIEIAPQWARLAHVRRFLTMAKPGRTRKSRLPTPMASQCSGSPMRKAQASAVAKQPAATPKPQLRRCAIEKAN